MRVVLSGLSVVGLAFFGYAGIAQTPPPSSANTAVSPDVNLTPRRVVIESNARGAKEITVFNRSNGTATYNIAIVDRVMTTEGALIELSEATPEQKAAHKSATQWLRYSPRQVTLGPNESQVVRIQARKPSDLIPGEYRAHFSVIAAPPKESGLDVAAAAGAAANNELNIRITPVYGITIPIVVRHGEISAQAKIEDVQTATLGGRPAIKFSIVRSGDRSLYGGAEVFLLNGSRTEKIAQVKGIGVYNEVDRRVVSVQLAEKAPTIGPGAQVRVIFTDDDVKPGTVLAQTEATLP